jgi:hypothetical protein
VGKLPIRPIIVVEAHPKEVEKNQMLQISCRIFDKKTLTLMEVSRIYMTITSLKDGHVIWPNEVIRKNASGFDIGIGTMEMKEGQEYLVRVSNNWNFSPSASVVFAVKKSQFPTIILLPIIFSPLFIKKYQDKGIRDVEGLVQYLKSQGLSDSEIKNELARIIKEVEMEEDVRIPIDLERRVVNKKWVTQVDHRVCKYCLENSVSGPNFDGIWPWDDPNAPTIPEHPNCRCTYELEYADNRDEEFRAAAVMSQFYDLEMPLDAIKVINNL